MDASGSGDQRRPYFLRAQFALVDPAFLPVTHGDIFQISGRDRTTGTLTGTNIFTGASGPLPRQSAAVYVEVTRRDVGYTQPVVLLGALSAHVHDLLLARRPDLFAAPVPHTTRPKRPHERHGAEYWFVRRETMESMLKNNLFVECGRLGEHLYGTSEAAIRSVAQREKKHCLLDASTSVPHLLARSLFPIVVFVGAQSWRQLQDVMAFSAAGGNEYQARDAMASDDQLLKDSLMYLSGLVRERSLDDSYHKVLALLERLRHDAWLPQVGVPAPHTPYGRLI